MIKYIGSKRRFIDTIATIIGDVSDGPLKVLDLFSGTSRVGHALKTKGHHVTANDCAAYAHALATCYVQADRDKHLSTVEMLVNELNRVPGCDGYFTDTFCERAMFFQPKNGRKIDAVRDAIAKKSLEPELEAILLTSLMEAADRVDNTLGIQMAYLKRWADRSFNDLTLRVPNMLHGGGSALNHDVRSFPYDDHVVDVAYLDPPYNQHSYNGNYHIWNTLVKNDRPETFGKANKRIDVKTTKSPFNSRKTSLSTFADVVGRLRCNHILVSFSDEGYISQDEMIEVLTRHGEVSIHGMDAKRYVGAQLGIYNNHGKIVSEPKHKTCKEWLYLVTK